MRIRMLIAAAVVGLGVLAPASAAVAQTKTIPPASEECIKLLEGGKTPDDCQKAPSPIKPATNELVWGALSFIIVFGLLSKLAYPAIKKAMDERTNKIREGLDDAERTRAEAQTILEEYQRQLNDARNESNRIIEEARQTAEQLRQDLMQRAEAEVGELRRRAQEDIAAAQERATADLRAQVAELAIELAEKVVERNLDRDTNMALIESFITQVGSSR
ncbi:MAG: F-type H+-transporting ATPase subunit b [Actinomycetota bacterium]|jgi:F-type H+-transporting ATPase subunit b|nr:F-type H+-transporting ATPase subunit b [Actinomycetota bacterium]